ncbi:MAG: class I SAM-dependent methyltransferase [Verrucomicrobia bacterium]|nr:class I SAM-dependent methyltransferase [Verrucomicrobiota bacterium]
MGMNPADIRHAFDLAAEHYRFRLPYVPAFFRRLSADLGLGGKERVLDLCCGTGQVAFGLAPSVGAVVGVDFSAAMLASAPKAPNLAYHQASAEAWAERADLEPFDLLTIGHAVHWLSPSVLGAVLARQLRPGGKVVILGNQWDAATAWLPALRRVESSYRSFDVADVDGRRKLGDLGFVPVSVCRHRFEARCDLAFMRRHVTSYARFARLIAEAPDRFEDDLTRALGPSLDEKGQLKGVALDWALTYSRA